MKIVCDTSAFLAVVLNEPERSRIVALTSGHELAAPAVLPFEIGNALVSMTRRGSLAPENVTAAWDALQAIPVELRPIELRAALEIALRFKIYAYDAYFLECALGLRAPLLTLDKTMQRLARTLNVQVLE